MKILVTGAPKSGKSTVIFEHITNTTQPTRGMVTKELRQNGTRIGFDITTSEGQVIRLARTNTHGKFQVGKFFVIDGFLNYSFVDLQRIKANELLYIDEIGQMQLLSDSFSTLAKKYINSGNDLLASVSSIFSNDLTVEILKREDVIVFQINESNRIYISRIIQIALENRKYYNELDRRVALDVAKLANNYISSDRFISADKLFSKALRYLVEERVFKTGVNEYSVNGDNARHNVTISTSGWTCDCKLASGKKPYIKADDCSHYQAVLLSMP